MLHLWYLLLLLTVTVYLDPNSKVFENSSKQNMMKPETNLVDAATA